METMDFIGNMPLIVVMGIIVFIFIINVYGLFVMFVRKEEVVVDNKDRYVYPKKECSGCDPECACLGNLKYNGELQDVYLDNKGDEDMKVLIKEYQLNYKESGNLQITIPGRYDSNELTWASTIDCKEYMRRNGKVYFRNCNSSVKVVVTVNK